MEHRLAPAVAHDPVELFGSFHLADTELALSVSALQEVVNYPASVTQVPLAPDFLLGLFNLRGTLIPIIHLSQLLQLSDDVRRESAKIAIVDIDRAKVGLLFDATGEILRVQTAQKVAFEHAENATAMISGALKLDDGRRILQVLSPGSLAGLQHLPRLTTENEGAQRQHQRMAQSMRRQAVSFRVSEARLALPMDAIHEIIRVPELQSSVLSSEFCLGTLNLRGHTVPVIDFARFLGLPARPCLESAEDERRIMVIREQDIHFGLLVDEVESIVGFHAEDVLPIPSFTRQRSSFFTGCIPSSEGQDIILLSREHLFTDATIDELIRGHRDLYVTGASGDATIAARRHVRETYVTFRLEHLIGIRIEQLREVIDYPAETIRPPGSPDHVCGIFKLRQQLVTVINLRSLYGMAPCADLASSKVLIVEENEEKYGLVVDCIENIIAIDTADKLPVPRVLLGSTRNTLQHDMKEVVEMSDQRTLMLLDVAPLKARLAAQSIQ